MRVGEEGAREDLRLSAVLTSSFAGLFCIVILAPVIPILHWTGWETFELPPTRTAWIICGVNMCITLSSDYLYVLGESDLFFDLPAGKGGTSGSGRL